MKTVLIRPPLTGLVARAGRRYNRAWPPLDLLNCAALLRQAGADVTVVDFQVEDISYIELRQMVNSAEFVFVTTSALDRWQCPHLNITKVLEFIRALPEEKTYVMGAHGTVDPARILAETGARGVIRGEPEGTVQELATGGTFENVCGISYLMDGEFVNNPNREPVDLKSLPLPAYDLIDLRYYSYELLGRRLALLETTRGCSFSCTFCFKKMYGKGVYSKTRDQVSTEIESVVHNHGASCIYFFDLEFTLKRDLVLQVCRTMRGLGRSVPWSCQTRPDLVDEALLREMAGSGCRLIHYGVESGSQRVLDMIQKRMDMETIKCAIARTHAAGIETACFFLFGFPGETPDEMKETLNYAKLLNPTYASFHIVTPYPGTVLHRFALGGNGFPQYCKTGLTPQALEQFVRHAFLSYYMRPGYVFQRLLRGNPGFWMRRVRLLLEFIK